MNPITANRRHYEDLAIGEVIDLGHVTVSKDMIITFAREFDPFPFHLDEAAAKASLLGGLAASGWQTAALSLKMLGEVFLNSIASMGGLGFSDLKWKKPVMVGDTIGGTATIATLRRSKSHPERGILTLDFDIRNQKGEPVMSMRLANLVEAREAAVEKNAPTGTDGATIAAAVIGQNSVFSPEAPLAATPVQPYDVPHGESSGGGGSGDSVGGGRSSIP
jgi:acyl dehydratase